MSEKRFLFRSFSLCNSKSAQKVGTDAVLLGAWAAQSFTPKTVADIGSGTGVIGMMLAQRFPMAQISLLENDAASLDECRKSLEYSPWKDRIQLESEDFLEWDSRQSFDLVISNPPYFLNSLPSAKEDRRKARHLKEHQFNSWLEKMTHICSPNGRIALIIPFQLNFDIPGWSNSRFLHVRNNPSKEPVRKLLELSLDANNCIEEKPLCIRDENGDWHDDYRALTKDFLYLDGLPEDPLPIS